MGSIEREITSPKCQVQPLDFSNPDEYNELLSQRRICGWVNTPEALNEWAGAMRDGKKSTFWICKPSTTSDEQAVRVGHISLDSEAELPDLEVANPHDRSVMTITRFFILPEHRNGGIGRAAMQLMEQEARKAPYGSPNCKTVAIVTLWKGYHTTEEGKREFEGLTGDELPALINEIWYESQGYVTWKKALSIEHMGPSGWVKLMAVYMRKNIA